MSSKRRIEASRRNGALSRGPKTAAGKSRSSQKAVKHGMLSERLLLSVEDPDGFEETFQQYLEKFDPQDGVEFAMIEQMVSCYWRMQRGLAIEKQLLDTALEHQTSGTQPKRLADAFTELEFGTSLKSIQRYESMLERMHTRTLKSLLLIRKIQPGNPELPNEPNPKIGHSETPPPDEPEASRNGLDRQNGARNGQPNAAAQSPAPAPAEEPQACAAAAASGPRPDSRTCTISGAPAVLPSGRFIPISDSQTEIRGIRVNPAAHNFPSARGIALSAHIGR